jgi:hypothetical protein
MRFPSPAVEIPTMSHRKILSVLLLFTIQSVAAGLGPWPLEIIERMDDAKLVVYGNERDIDASPAWNPDAGAPPLDIAGVVEALNRWAASDSRVDAVHVEEIELKPIPRRAGHWYYLVRARVEAREGAPVRYFAVLMNGKVEPAIREPMPIK